MYTTEPPGTSNHRNHTSPAEQPNHLWDPNHKGEVLEIPKGRRRSFRKKRKNLKRNGWNLKHEFREMQKRPERLERELSIHADEPEIESEEGVVENIQEYFQELYKAPYGT